MSNDKVTFKNPYADRYQYDVEYENEDGVYMTSDYIEPDFIEAIQKTQNNGHQMFKTTVKEAALDASEASKTHPEKILNMEQVEYYLGDDVIANEKYVEPDYYPTIEEKLSVENKDFATTQKSVAREQTVITKTPVNSVQNMAANQGDWKKPVLIGAACLAAIWFFNQD